jgi:hypothetical protein
MGRAGTQHPMKDEANAAVTAVSASESRSLANHIRDEKA